jgi:hypothetical protein
MRRVGVLMLCLVVVAVFASGVVAAEKRAAKWHKAEKLQLKKAKLMERAHSRAKGADRASKVLGPFSNQPFTAAWGFYTVVSPGTAYHVGYRYDTADGFPASWYPFNVAAMRTYAKATAGQAMVQGGLAGGVYHGTSFAPATTGYSIYTYAPAGFTVAAGAFYHGAIMWGTSAGAAGVFEVATCFNGLSSSPGVGTYWNNQYSFTPAGATRTNQFTCGFLGGTYNSWLLMFSQDVILTSYYPVELMKMSTE